MQFETALAKASLDNVARRDPEATDHKTTFAELQKMSPQFDWNGFFAGGEAAGDSVECAGTEVSGGIQSAIGDGLGCRLEDLPEMAFAAPNRRRILSQAFVDENFNFYQKTLAGVGEISRAGSSASRRPTCCWEKR